MPGVTVGLAAGVRAGPDEGVAWGGAGTVGLAGKEAGPSTKDPDGVIIGGETAALPQPPTRTTTTARAPRIGPRIAIADAGLRDILAVLRDARATIGIREPTGSAGSPARR
jgi:hypothetical protein